MIQKELTQEIVRELLDYNSETGSLTWKVREPKANLFPDNESRRPIEWVCKNWNSRWAGKEAFTAINTWGYKNGNILGKLHRAHRIIWLWWYGIWPDEVDHINRIRTDNRIENLEDVSSAKNNKNQKKPLTNTSGVVGVYWHKQRECWNAKIGVSGKNLHLGLFQNFEDAVAARKAAERLYGFRETHGQE